MTLPTSNSSEKPWDKWARSDEPPDPLPPPSTSTLPLSSGGNNIPNAKRFEQYIEKYAQAVLQIRVSENKRGTGCLIGGNLLITNHHVIATPEEAEKAEVRCWAVIDTSDSSGIVEWKKLKLNPSEYFETSPNHITDEGVQLADKDHLDYTIIALENDPFLRKIHDSCLVLFSKAKARNDQEICIIHHSDTIDDETQIRGGRERAFGKIHRIKELTLHHDAIAQQGSSGSPIIDSKGQFIALHHQRDECLDSLSRDYRYAVFTSAIATDLQRKNKLDDLKQRIAESKKNCAGDDSTFAFNVENVSNICLEIIKILNKSNSPVDLHLYAQLINTAEKIRFFINYIKPSKMISIFNTALEAQGFLIDELQREDVSNLSCHLSNSEGVSLVNPLGYDFQELCIESMKKRNRIKYGWIRLFTLQVIHSSMEGKAIGKFIKICLSAIKNDWFTCEIAVTSIVDLINNKKLDDDQIEKFIDASSQLVKSGNAGGHFAAQGLLEVRTVIEKRFFDKKTNRILSKFDLLKRIKLKRKPLDYADQCAKALSDGIDSPQRYAILRRFTISTLRGYPKTEYYNEFIKTCCRSIKRGWWSNIECAIHLAQLTRHGYLNDKQKEKFTKACLTSIKATEKKGRAKHIAYVLLAELMHEKKLFEEQKKEFLKILNEQRKSRKVADAVVKMFSIQV
ncbi:MAG: hypothetical protein ChlgKO_08770 [Chlamydiales bacterium]